MVEGDTMKCEHHENIEHCANYYMNGFEKACGTCPFSGLKEKSEESAAPSTKPESK